MRGGRPPAGLVTFRRECNLRLAPGATKSVRYRVSRRTDLLSVERTSSRPCRYGWRLSWLRQQQSLLGGVNEALVLKRRLLGGSNRPCAVNMESPVTSGKLGALNHGTRRKEPKCCRPASISCSIAFPRLRTVAVALLLRRAYRAACDHFFGVTSPLRSSERGCIPGGESPWGLDAGVPPDVVSIGPG